MIETVSFANKLFAIIIPHNFSEPGVNFFTPHNLSQQLAFIKHPPGHLIEPHMHNPVPREVLYTQEVLLVRKGRLRVNFYDDDRQFVDSRELGAGDVILLAEGGHGFEVLEELEMIEVKQGPYAGESDKTRFVMKVDGVTK
jgi:mannose-6-phosphate isomerase-like protein (cupin superfamily)